MTSALSLADDVQGLDRGAAFSRWPHSLDSQQSPTPPGPRQKICPQFSHPSAVASINKHNHRYDGPNSNPQSRFTGSIPVFSGEY